VLGTRVDVSKTVHTRAARTNCSKSTSIDFFSNYSVFRRLYTCVRIHIYILVCVYIYKNTNGRRARAPIDRRNYKSCYVLDVIHLKNSETEEVCRRRRVRNHIRISRGNYYGSLTSRRLNLFPLAADVIFPRPSRVKKNNNERLEINTPGGNSRAGRRCELKTIDAILLVVHTTMSANRDWPI